MKISAKYLGIEDICLDKFDYMYTITIKENVDHKSTFTCGVSSLREYGKAYRSLQVQSPSQLRR